MRADVSALGGLDRGNLVVLRSPAFGGAKLLAIMLWHHQPGAVGLNLLLWFLTREGASLAVSHFF